jgi:hypothetical protein
MKFINALVVEWWELIVTLHLPLEWIKTRCVVWKNTEKTRQIRLDNGERPRAYMLTPMYDAEAADPESAKSYWINNLREKTDTELGVIYNSKGTIKPFF